MQYAFLVYHRWIYESIFFNRQFLFPSDDGPITVFIKEWLWLSKIIKKRAFGSSKTNLALFYAIIFRYGPLWIFVMDGGPSRARPLAWDRRLFQRLRSNSGRFHQIQIWWVNSVLFISQIKTALLRSGKMSQAENLVCLSAKLKVWVFWGRTIFKIQLS